MDSRYRPFSDRRYIQDKGFYKNAHYSFIYAHESLRIFGYGYQCFLYKSAIWFRHYLQHFFTKQTRIVNEPCSQYAITKDANKSLFTAHKLNWTELNSIRELQCEQPHWDTCVVMRTKRVISKYVCKPSTNVKRITQVTNERIVYTGSTCSGQFRLVRISSCAVNKA